MLKRNKKELHNDRFKSLFSKSTTDRILFKDIETFEDLYARNSDIEFNETTSESTKIIIEKPSKLVIIEPTFENFLHQISQELKEVYNAIKNILLSYEGVVANYEKYSEVYKVNDKVIFSLHVVGNYIQLSYNKVTYNINVMSKVTLLDDEIKLLMTENNIGKKSDYSQVDYITEFPQLENCIIMDEEIVGNLPFKVRKK